MRYLRSTELQSLPRNINKSEEGLIKEARQQPAPHVFLSHSHRDRNELGGVLALLDAYRAPTYLDYEDDRLPRITSSATADGLRRAIDSCARMIVAASGKLRLSKWVPWEIGYADGSKGIANVALLPISPDGHEVGIEQEYLDSYPRIGVKDGSTTLIVWDPRDNKHWNLKEWLFQPVT